MKNVKNKFLILSLLTGIILLAITCKHEIPLPDNNGNGNDTTTQTNSCSPDTVYFINEILPLLNSNCATSGCHDAASHQGRVVLSNYSKIKSLVVPFNASESRLYNVVKQTGEDRMPPPPRAALTAQQLAKLEKWINQGALNNQCTSNCDTTVFTYAGAVSITLSTYCKGCHNSVSSGGGIDLSSYAKVKIQALNGNLLGTITHAAGYSPMPKGDNILSDCEIRQIEKWIEAGALNN
jgi:hypothetical protein